MSSYVKTNVTGTPVSTVLAIPFNFIDPSHVQIRVSNVSETANDFEARLMNGSVAQKVYNVDYTISGFNVTILNSALLNGSNYWVEIRRVTPFGAFVTFSNGNFIKSADVNKMFNQALYALEEAATQLTRAQTFLRLGYVLNTSTGKYHLVTIEGGTGSEQVAIGAGVTL